MSWWRLLSARAAVLLRFWLSLWVLIPVRSDERYYSDTNAHVAGHDYLSLSSNIIAHNTVTLAASAYAGSSDVIYFTYIGTFASSGPHHITDLAMPTRQYSFDIKLDREIGALTSIWMENVGYDSLLIDSWSLLIKGTVYDMSIPQIWLQSFNATRAELNGGNGYSPEADLPIEGSATVLATVVGSYVAYNDTGSVISN